MYSSDRKNSQQRTKKLKQLSLFEISRDSAKIALDSEEQRKNLDKIIPSFYIDHESYSNMIDIWDLLPKYYFSTKQIDKIEFPWQKIRDERYQVTLRPTVRKNDNKSKTITGPIRVKFPGLREMYVEEALTKLAASNFKNSIEAHEIELKNSSKQYLVSVNFTLYDLEQELKRVGHTYSYDEIKEALMVLKETTMYIKAVAKDPHNPSNRIYFEHYGSIISELQLISKDSNFETGKTKSRVVFHQLKTIGVMNVAFRKYDYDKSMRLSSYLTKYIYNRLVTNWRQASAANKYTFLMNNFIHQSCREPSKTIYSDIRAMRNSLKELVDKKILYTFHEDPIRKNRKTIDVHFSLIPDNSFVRDTKYANYNQRKLQSDIELSQRKLQSDFELTQSQPASKTEALQYLSDIKNLLKKHK